MAKVLPAQRGLRRRAKKELADAPAIERFHRENPSHHGAQARLVARLNETQPEKLLLVLRLLDLKARAEKRPQVVQTRRVELDRHSLAKRADQRANRAWLNRAREKTDHIGLEAGQRASLGEPFHASLKLRQARRASLPRLDRRHAPRSPTRRPLRAGQELAVPSWLGRQFEDGNAERGSIILDPL